MANCSRCRCRLVSTQESAATREPPVRHWPHLPESPIASTPRDAAYDIRCALARQTQLLSEIKDLLERLANTDAASHLT